MKQRRTTAVVFLPFIPGLGLFALGIVAAGLYFSIKYWPLILIGLVVLVWMGFSRSQASLRRHESRKCDPNDCYYCANL